MNSTLRSLAILLITFSLSACVVHVNDDSEYEYDDWDSSSYDDWQERQRYNRKAIRELVIGDTVDDTLARMGDADFMDVFMRGDVEVRVLRYRTQHEHSDGVTSEDETTPLVFENGALVGWGELSFQRATGL